MKLLVKGEFSCLSEGFVASVIWTFEWFLTCVNVGVLFQVLPESELLVANHTNVLLGRGMG